MKRALIITPVDPTSCTDDQASRLLQMMSIYQRLESTADLMFCGLLSGTMASRAGLRALANNLAVLPGEYAAGDALNPEAAHRLIAEITASNGRYDIVHLDQVMLPRRTDLGRIWLLDRHDTKIFVPNDFDPFDLAIVSLQDGLTEATAQTVLHVPLCGRQDAAVSVGEMIGWCGPWTPEMCEQWSETLHAVAQRGQRMQANLLLSGPGSEAVDVPPVLSPQVLVQPKPRPGARLALAMAVLPVDLAPGCLGAIMEFTERGVPTTLTPEAAGRFHGTWHMPTAPGKWERADAIQAWSDPAARASTVDALAETVMALQRDADTKLETFSASLAEALTAQASA